MKENLREALKILTLSNSDTRDATIESLIIGAIQEFDKIDVDKLPQRIQETYDVLINNVEILKSVETLAEKYSIINKSGSLEIHQDFKIDLADRTIYDKTINEKRKLNFEKNIKTISDQTLYQEEIDLLFDCYDKYINEVFYLNGKSAYEYFRLLGKYSGFVYFGG